MSLEKDILKWFDGQMGTEEIKHLHPDEDFSILEKTKFYSKQIDVPKRDPRASLVQFKEKYNSTPKTKVMPLKTRTILKYAAVLVIMLSVSYITFFNDAEKFTTAIAQTETINLPDNSEVVLNSQSVLTYDKSDWEKDRLVKLNGEAFFKVTKGKTFRVESSNGIVEVLGTQFNIKQRKDYFEVLCYEGSVGVDHLGKNYVLTKGKSYRWIKNKVIELRNFNQKNPSWLYEESSFDNVPLWQVIDEIEVQYNVSVISESIDFDIPFTGSFTHQNLNVAMQSVTIPLKLSYKVDGAKIYLYNYNER